MWGGNLYVDPSNMWQDKSESTRCHHVYPGYWELGVAGLQLLSKADNQYPPLSNCYIQHKAQSILKGSDQSSPTRYIDLPKVHS